MRYLVAKDKKLRKKTCSFEIKKVLFKTIIVNKFLKGKCRLKASIFRSNITIYSVRIKNYCIISSRSRSIIRKFKISRMCFKELTSFGYLKGIKKSSW